MKRPWAWIAGGMALLVLLGTTVWVGSGHARMPLILVPFVLVHRALDPEKVASLGEDLGENLSASAEPVSERFGTGQLRQLLDLLNSEAFQSALTNFNCGDPVPRLQFQVTLFRTSAAHSGARRVEVRHAPAMSAAGRNRCLSFGLGYLLDKAVARIDPDPGAARSSRTTRAPHCDCARRDGGQEWVTHPGPDEPLW